MATIDGKLSQVLRPQIFVEKKFSFPVEIKRSFVNGNTKFVVAQTVSVLAVFRRNVELYPRFFKYCALCNTPLVACDCLRGA